MWTVIPKQLGRHPLVQFLDFSHVLTKTWVFTPNPGNPFFRKCQQEEGSVTWPLARLGCNPSWCQSGDRPHDPGLDVPPFMTSTRFAPLIPWTNYLCCRIHATSLTLPALWEPFCPHGWTSYFEAPWVETSRRISTDGRHGMSTEKQKQIEILFLPSSSACMLFLLMLAG